MNYKQHFFLIPLSFLFSIHLFSTDVVNRELLEVFKEVIPAESLSFLQKHFFNKDILKLLLKGSVKNKTRLNPFYQNKNGVSVISIILKEKLIKNFVLCAELYPEEMSFYFEKNGNSIPLKFHHPSFICYYPHFLGRIIEFLKHQNATLSLKDFDNYLISLSKKHEHFLDFLLDKDFIRVLKVIDVISSHINIFGSSYSSKAHQIFRKLLEIATAENKTDSAFNKSVKLIRLILTHGWINPTEIKKILHGLGSSELFFQRVMCEKYLYHFSYLRKNGITNSYFNFILTHGDKLTQELLFSAADKPQAIDLVQGLNVAEGLSYRADWTWQYIPRAERYSLLQNLKYTGWNKKVPSDVTNYMIHTFLKDEFSIAEDKDFWEEISKKNTEYLQEMAFLLYRALLSKYISSYPQPYIYTDQNPKNQIPPFFFSFQEILEECKRLVRLIIEKEAKHQFKFWARGTPNIFSEKVLETIIRICLRTHICYFPQFDRCLHFIIRNIRTLFSSYEDLEQFITKHKNANFDELFGWCKRKKRIKKYNSQTIQKKIEKMIRFHDEMCHSKYHFAKPSSSLNFNEEHPDILPEHSAEEIKYLRARLEPSTYLPRIENVKKENANELLEY